MAESIQTSGNRRINPVVVNYGTISAAFRTSMAAAGRSSEIRLGHVTGTRDDRVTYGPILAHMVAVLASTNRSERFTKQLEAEAVVATRGLTVWHQLQREDPTAFKYAKPTILKEAMSVQTPYAKAACRIWKILQLEDHEAATVAQDVVCVTAPSWQNRILVPLQPTQEAV